METHELATKTDKQLNIHEAVCAERYADISRQLKEGDKRMNKIEYMLYVVIILVLFGPGVAAEFVKKLIGI